MINLRRFLLLIQIFIFCTLEYFLPQELKFFSSFGVNQTYICYPVFIIPAILFVATFFSQKYRPYLFATSLVALLKSAFIAGIVISFFLLFFTTVSRFKKNYFFTAGLVLLIFTITILTGFNVFQINNWFWIILHVSWSLKLIAWIVSTRVYSEEYSFNEFLEYFFNPVFYFFTNDLNVLTPKRYFASRVLANDFRWSDFFKNFKQSISGIVMIVAYGLIQKHYFLNLNSLGWLGSPYVGGIISVFVAILFHAANCCIQVSMLNAYQFSLSVDMNSPWQAHSPADYWKRMHFYVRDYIFEIVAKPILTFLMRWNFELSKIRIYLIFVLYFLFTCTQIGYQPYRQDRTLLVGFLVTAVFVAMMTIPELLWKGRAQRFFQKNKTSGRLITFFILYAGYALIFLVRQGF